MAKKKILIIEDEKDIVEMIKYNLNKEGYATSTLFRGRDAVSSVKKDQPDLVILDLMLPDIDGFEICKELRANERTAYVPIIMLTAKSQEADKVTGLELGADDYVTKPFSPRELLARIKAVLRRKAPRAIKKTIEIGPVFIDGIRHKVFVDGKEIKLTSTEFKLLTFMAQRPGAVLSRDKLLDGVFGYDANVYDRTVDSHIKSLRKKLGKERDCIETIRGAGYRFKEP